MLGVLARGIPAPPRLHVLLTYPPDDHHSSDVGEGRDSEIFFKHSNDHFADVAGDRRIIRETRVGSMFVVRSCRRRNGLRPRFSFDSSS